MLHCTNRTILTLIELDRLKEALEVVEKGLLSFPAYADFYCYKGLILEKVGLASLAVQWFELCLDGLELASWEGRTILVSVP